MAATPNLTMPRVVLINDGFFLGGIEVLELKIARRLVDLGFSVTIACRASSKLKPEIAGVELLQHLGLSDLCTRYPKLHGGTPNVILASFHPKSALASIIISEKLTRSFRNTPTLFHWVSHSRAFFFGSNPVTLSFLKKTFFKLPRESTFFMNDAARDSHERYWRQNLSDYPVLRIVGRPPLQQKTNYASSRKIRIASIGRLVPFKAYNIHSPKIIRELVDGGLDVEWDIWGYGPDQEKIQDNAQRLGVADRVRLNGALDHGALDETVKNYDLFVGMGTAAIEAAKVGVPTILALENGFDRGYGFIAAAPGDSVGDKIDGAPEERIAETILRFAQLSPTERAALGAACIEAALARESNIDEFIEIMLKESRKTSFTPIEAAWLFLGRNYLRFECWRNSRKTT